MSMRGLKVAHFCGLPFAVQPKTSQIVQSQIRSCVANSPGFPPIGYAARAGVACDFGMPGRGAAVADSASAPALVVAGAALGSGSSSELSLVCSVRSALAVAPLTDCAAAVMPTSAPVV